MCGIAGAISNKPIEAERLSQTMQRMKNRGPDAAGYIQLPFGDRQLSLLHSRLSIIDLDPRSNQPFSIGQYTIIFNGEIYNFIELRKELEAKGIRFISSSDTEVLLRFYIDQGLSAFDRFEGMWALAILDLDRRKLLLSRDRFGEKPLYFYESDDRFLFGSEVKFIAALNRTPLEKNLKHVSRYLVNGFRSLYKTDQTYYSDLKELPPATILTLQEGGAREIVRYWDPPVKIDHSMPYQAAVDGVRTRLTKSLELRLRADVPLAFCLSGGVDSAALASIAKKQFGASVSTFSIIDSDRRYDERENILHTVRDLGCDHTLIETTTKNFLPRLERLIRYHDGPLATISYYVHSFLSEAIAQAGFKVAISGTGADEIFTGYYDHFLLHLYELRNSREYKPALQAWQSHILPNTRNPFLVNPDLYVQDPRSRAHIYLNRDIFNQCLRVPFDEDFVEENYHDSLLRNRMLNELLHEIVPVILHEDDLNSMLFSVENRSPYLDRDLISFAGTIPNQHLIRDGYGKALLRDAVKGILNDQVRLDHTKKGFNAALHSLIDFQDPETRSYLLSDGPIMELVLPEKIEELMDLPSLPNSYSKFLFNFVNAKIFLEMSL